uniref:Uncharacterized protein n=1 Tax=Ficedula albicollis TaxID=59894 RepID=A0A803WBS1_FICAL
PTCIHELWQPHVFVDWQLNGQNCSRVLCCLACTLLMWWIWAENIGKTFWETTKLTTSQISICPLLPALDMHTHNHWLDLESWSNLSQILLLKIFLCLQILLFLRSSCSADVQCL